jgi:iron complex outermembrane receptor protein
LGVRYVGSSYGDSENTFKVPSYALLDAAVHYDFAGLGSDLEGWQLAVNAKNLLDKSFIASCERLDRCFQGVGRNVLATLKFRW